ncbi:MAG: DoxX family protein [Bacteroidales bacterium]|nr:DoxX family protein [Bacteroidales bacterium]
MKILSIICRIFLGFVFIFSGFVKGIDPLGSTYKFIDYFIAFGIEWLEPLAFPLSIILIIAEFAIGVSLFVGLRMLINSWATLIFMISFTILTFFLAIFNPVSDCGCFGDALILTNWETFWKNIFIMVPTLIVFINKKRFKQLFSVTREWIIITFIAVVFFLVSLYSYNYLPFIDFRPYELGSYIPEKMEIPLDAPKDIYETYLYYEKNGVVKEFTTDDYPWQDSTWKWLDTKSVLIKKGFHPPIHDFTIETLDGEDITDIILEDDRYYFLLISYALEKANKDKGIQNKINELAEYCITNNYPFICLTSSTGDQFEDFIHETGATYEFYNTDETTLKTIIRSNPGLVLLKEGTIIDKWHYNDIPSVDELDTNFIAATIKKYKKKQDMQLIINLFSLGILLLSVYKLSKLYYTKIK